MFLNIMIVTIPAFGMVYFAIWLLTTFMVYRCEDRLDFTGAYIAQLVRLIALPVLALIAITQSLGSYAWFNDVVLAFTMMLPGITLSMLLYTGYDNIFAGMIDRRHHDIEWSMIGIVTWAVALFATIVFLIFSLAALLRCDSFFEAVIEPNTLKEYHLAYSDYLDSRNNWEDIALYGE